MVGTCRESEWRFSSNSSHSVVSVEFMLSAIYRSLTFSGSAGAPIAPSLDKHTGLQREIVGYFNADKKLAASPERLANSRVEHIPPKPIVLLHQPIEVRAAELSADGGHPIPQLIFEYAVHRQRRVSRCMRWILTGVSSRHQLVVRLELPAQCSENTWLKRTENRMIRKTVLKPAHAAPPPQSS